MIVVFISVEDTQARSQGVGPGTPPQIGEDKINSRAVPESGS